MTGHTDAWMPLWIGDYLADTRHLTTEQHGAYLLLIMAYWRRRGPLPADDAQLCRMAGVTIYKWRSLRPIICAFFQESDGTWFHKRADAELVKAEASYNRLAAAGRKGAEVRKINSGRAKYVTPNNIQFAHAAASKVSSSTSPTATNGADDDILAENSQVNDSHAAATPPAMLQQSQSPIDAGTTVGSNHEAQNQAEPLLVCFEQSKPPPLRPASKPISSKIERGTRWSPDRAVPDEWLMEAAADLTARGLAVIDLNLSAATFRDYWVAQPGAKGLKLDWHATFRNWAREDAKRQKGKFNGRSTPTGQSGKSCFDVFADDYLKDRAEREARESSRH
jgi:uncharacterized protein YdaU (DUF1376 family)